MIIPNAHNFWVGAGQTLCKFTGFFVNKTLKMQKRVSKIMQSFVSTQCCFFYPPAFWMFYCIYWKGKKLSPFLCVCFWWLVFYYRHFLHTENQISHFCLCQCKWSLSVVMSSTTALIFSLYIVLLDENPGTSTVWLKTHQNLVKKRLHAWFFY